MKKTEVFDHLDNAIGNYMDGSCTAEELAEVANRANRYLVEHPHPHGVEETNKENRAPVNIELKCWDYKCGDGCCTDYGTSLSVNGVESENEYIGNDVSSSIEFVLKQLGYEPNIIES